MKRFVKILLTHSLDVRPLPNLAAFITDAHSTLSSISYRHQLTFISCKSLSAYYNIVHRTNYKTEFHSFTVHFNSLYIMVQLMHLFVIKH
jgi:hypothetical protein